MTLLTKPHLTLARKTLPTTIEQAVDWVISNLSGEQRAEFASGSEEEIRFGFGMWIRNTLGLWSGNEELLKACGKTHPDDASAVIIHAVRKKGCRTRGSI